MIFEPGHSYFELTPEDYTFLAVEMEGSAMLSDFKLADNGKYYADAGAIDDDEYSFLIEWGLANSFNYKKSTQSTSPV